MFKVITISAYLKDMIGDYQYTRYTTANYVSKDGYMTFTWKIFTDSKWAIEDKNEEIGKVKANFEHGLIETNVSEDGETFNATKISW